MNKSTAIRLLGGSAAKAARELGVTTSAVSQWPDGGDLPEATENRVLAWLARKHLPLKVLTGEIEGQQSPAGGTSLGEEAPRAAA